jgi:hypothetical protein
MLRTFALSGNERVLLAPNRFELFRYLLDGHHTNVALTIHGEDSFFIGRPHKSITHCTIDA